MTNFFEPKNIFKFSNIHLRLPKYSYLKKLSVLILKQTNPILNINSIQMAMKRTALMILFLLFTASIHAQMKGQARIDSLLNVLSAKKEDTNKVNILIDLSYTSYSINPESGINFGNQALELSKKLNWAKGMGRAYHSIGINYGYGTSEYMKALDFMYKSISIYESSTLKQEAANQYMNIARFYIKKKDLDKANEAYSHALKIYESLKDKLSSAKVLHKIGSMYDDNFEYSKALNYYLNEIKLYNPKIHKNLLSVALLEVGNCYYYLSDYPRSLEYYLLSLKVSEESGDKIYIARSLGNIGNVYTAIKEYNKALPYYLKTVKLFEELGKLRSLALNNTNVGIAFFYLKDYNHALEYYLKALKISEENNFDFEQELVLGNIGELYRMQNDYNKALEYNFKALEISKKLSDKNGIAYNYGDIGKSYFEKAKDSINFGYSSTNFFQLAKSYHDSSILVYKELEDLNGLSSEYQVLSEAQYRLGDYKGAMTSYKQFFKLKDSVFNIEKDKKITQQAMQFEFDKKETELLYTQRLTKEQLQKQMLLTKQQQQELELREKNLEIINKEKDLEKLNHQKTQVELNEQKLTNEKKEVQLTLERKEVASKKQQRNYYIVGMFLFILLSFFIFRNYLNQRKSNIIITKEKERSEKLLLNILPYEVAEELKLKGSTKAKDFEKVTVLFTDFKGFTQISEQMTPSQLVGEINFYFSTFDNIIGKHGIEKIKTIGDSYMCAGGIPAENNTHPENVVNAALEIRDFMLQQKQEKLLKGEIPFEIRIGVHTGPVVAGIVGVKKFAYDIWGDTVNTASRMESSCEPGNINISGSTYELVKEKFICKYRGKIEAKNKGEIDMYFVFGNI